MISLFCNLGEKKSTPETGGAGSGTIFLQVERTHLEHTYPGKQLRSNARTQEQIDFSLHCAARMLNPTAPRMNQEQAASSNAPVHWRLLLSDHAAARDESPVLC